MSQPSAQYRLIRPDDHLELLLIAERLTERARASGGRELVANLTDAAGKPAAGFLTIRIQAQHTIEWAGIGTQPPATQPRPILGDLTSVRFRVPANGVVVLTVEGVLAALRTLQINLPLAPPPPVEIRVAARPAAELVRGSGAAAASGGPDPLLAERARRADVWFPALTAPPAEDSAPPAAPVLARTELHFPSRLVMDVHGSVGFDHVAEPAERDGRVELWHTRLKRRAADGTLTEKPNLVSVIRTQELPAGATSNWATRVGDDSIRSALSKGERTTLAQQTGSSKATAQRLELSAHGAWLDVDWKGPTLSWEHRLAQGRDQYVRTAVLGTLYPLGHEALLVKRTERIWPKRNGLPAFLQTSSTIYVLERTRTYPINTRVERAWPWEEVRLETRRVSGTLEGVASDANGKTASLMMASAGLRAPFLWECVARDRGHHVIRFELPLYFLAKGFNNFAGLEQIYLKDNAGIGHGGESFRTVRVAGQRVAVAAARPGAPDATDMVVDQFRLAPPSKIFEQDPVKEPPQDKPAVEQLSGALPALQQLVPGASNATVKFAGQYLNRAFGSGNVGEALLELAPGTRPVVDLSGRGLTGGLLAPQYELTGLSRRFGPVGGLLADVADGQFTPEQLFKGFLDKIKLLGVFALSDVLDAKTRRALEDAPQLSSTGQNGIATPKVSWTAELFTGVKEVTAGIAPAKGVLRPRGAEKAMLVMLAETTLDQANATRTRVSCDVQNIELAFSLQNEELLVVPIRNLTFVSVNGGKIDVDVNLGTVEFKGVLAFIRTLADLVPADGFHDPPALDVRPDGVTSSFSLPLPPVAAGVFVLENIALHAQLELFFTGGAPTFELAFARPESPFRVTVAALGGGGWVAVKVATDGFRHLAGALEFGAAVTIDLFVARGSVSAMGGLSFFVDGDGFARLTAYFTVRGELRVLGLISVSVELTLALGYESPPARLCGKASLVVKVKLLFISKSVKVELEKTFAGADGPGDSARALGTAGPPTFADLMAPGAWNTYCLSYAEDA
ncbi:hypothetical protein OJ998_13840 [Solirubrobacter taibaiensis]|nr:hypothetical protein [Solirubrobacter taibaiensis]